MMKSIKSPVDDAKAGLANAGAAANNAKDAAKAGLANAGAAAAASVKAAFANDKEGLVSVLPGFRIMVLMVLVGLVFGFIVVGIIYIIHYTESTKKMLIFLSIIVLVIFGVCMKKAPRAYLFSLLSIVMLLAAMGFGFIYDFPFPFRVIAGCLAVGAGLIKVYFY